MLLRRVSVLGLAMLSLGGAVTLANHNKFLPQAVAQTIENQPGTQSQPPHERNQSQLIQELNLNQDQVQKMQAIRQQYKDQIAQTKQQLRQAKQELSDLMAGTAPADEVRAKHRQVEALQQQVGESRFESTLAIRELLTPEQRVKFVERMQRHWQKG